MTTLYYRDIEALLEKLKLDEVTLVGFASSGHVALRLASQLGKRVTKLVTSTAVPNSAAAMIGYGVSQNRESRNSWKLTTGAALMNSRMRSSIPKWSSGVCLLRTPTDCSPGSDR